MDETTSTRASVVVVKVVVEVKVMMVEMRFNGGDGVGGVSGGCGGTDNSGTDGGGNVTGDYIVNGSEGGSEKYNHSPIIQTVIQLFIFSSNIKPLHLLKRKMYRFT